jgi:TRAP transporter 4TM/12TM fusion protein
MVDKVAQYLGRRSRYLDIALALIALLWATYQLTFVAYVFHDVILLENTHLLGALLVFCLVGVRQKPHRWLFYLFLMLLGTVPLVYVELFYFEITERTFALTTLDVILGTVLLVAVLVACYDAYGWVLTGLATLFLVYLFFGFLLPGFLQTSKINFDRAISILSMGFTGIYGVALAASASYIFLFLLFGAILQETGGTGFFIELGKFITNKLKLTGGMGQTAVISSGLVGMVTGSAAANVAITGNFTIPAMKRAGYRPEIAGAIEAVASSGGQIIPPVMGAVAFVMVAFTGIPYVRLMYAAAIPALAYVVCAGTSVELLARRQQLSREVHMVDFKLLFSRLSIFLIPLGVLTYILIEGMSPMYAAVGGIVALVAVSFVRKETRLSFGRLSQAVVAGASSAAPIAIACACVGIIVDVLGITGLDIKLPAMVEAWSHGYLFLALLMTMFICILLGCGMPTIPIYIVVAIAAAPALIRMGMDLLPAHFFVLFLGVASFLTPPVAMAAIVAAGIAGSSYIKTAVQSVRIGIMIYLIPFLYAYNPVILGQWKEYSLPSIFVTLLSLFLGILPLCASLGGYYIRRVSWAQRFALAASWAGLWGYIIEQNYLFFAIGTVLLIVVTLAQLRKKKAPRGAAINLPINGTG